VERLCELPQDLVALAVHRLVLVVDIDVLEEMVRPGDEEAEAIERALDNAAFEEWEELRVIAREPDAWDDVWSALMALDRDHHERLRQILERCCEMTLEYISGQGGLYQVLTADEMLDSDVAAARDDRRSAEGFVSPADARAFLELARRGPAGDERDAITRAYFRRLEATTIADAPRRGAGAARDGGKRLATAAAAAADVQDLAALLREAQVIAPAAAQPLAALTAPEVETAGRAATPAQTHLVAPLFEQAMRDLRERDPDRFAARAREVGFLVNVWIAGGAHEGRRPAPADALEMVLKTCEAGLRAQLAPAPITPAAALSVLGRTPADALFRSGFRGREARQKRP
jgi:hypothetical protein